MCILGPHFLKLLLYVFLAKMALGIPIGGSLGIELAYSTVIIISCLIVYFGTKELFELSQYKGIKYFRNAFLFFALAYFSRFFIKYMFILSGGTIGSRFQVIFASMLIFIFASTLAVLYLFSSVMWKKLERLKVKTWHIYGAALLITLLTVLPANPILPLLLQLVLMIFVILVSYIRLKKTKRKAPLHGVYMLLFVFWLLNIFDVLISNLLSVIQLGIYLVSIVLFLVILYKVAKAIGGA